MAVDSQSGGSAGHGMSRNYYHGRGGRRAARSGGSGASRGAGTRVTTARVVAAEILAEQRRRSAHARDLLRTSPLMGQLSARDRAFVTRLVLGVVATEGVLDRAIARHLRSNGELEPKVRDCLRVSAYEMLYLGTEPAVAVSQGVSLVKHVNVRASGLANAVLRRIGEEDVPAMRAAVERVQAGTGPDAPSSADEASLAADLALVAGVPVWIVRGALSSYGTAEACVWALAQREPAPIYVAGNLRVQSDEACENMLRSRYFQPERTSLAGAWALGKATHLAKSGLVHEARVLPSDLSAQLVARVATPRPAEEALEVGQGRATKSILMLNNALRLGGEATVVGVDSEQFKCDVARERFALAGWESRTQTYCLDARDLGDLQALPEGLQRSFDVVFVDAPCSGVGTIRRHPEIAWSLRHGDVQGQLKGELPRLQLELLRAAAFRVAPGGSLVYATCSFLPAEDEEVVRAFLREEIGRQFTPAPTWEAPGVAGVGDGAAELLSSCSTPDGFSRLRPSQGAFDQHFCARLVRRG